MRMPALRVGAGPDAGGCARPSGMAGPARPRRRLPGTRAGCPWRDPSGIRAARRDGRVCQGLDEAGHAGKMRAGAGFEVHPVVLGSDAGRVPGRSGQGLGAYGRGPNAPSPARVVGYVRRGPERRRDGPSGAGRRVRIALVGKPRRGTGRSRAWRHGGRQGMAGPPSGRTPPVGRRRSVAARFVASSRSAAGAFPRPVRPDGRGRLRLRDRPAPGARPFGTRRGPGAAQPGSGRASSSNTEPSHG